MILSFEQFIHEKKNPCWKGYKQIGTKNKRGKIVPNCVKVNESSQNFDRAQFYLDYYKNLSPSDFDIQRYSDSIVIKLPSNQTGLG